MVNVVTSKFKRTVENFVCEHCGVQVTGNGYTNHCPKCLWSKHVDINPGDRANYCHDLMQPIGIEKHGDTTNVVHKCVKCGFTKHNKSTSEDNFETILRLSQNPVPN